MLRTAALFALALCLLTPDTVRSAADVPDPLAAKVKAAIQRIATAKAEQYKCGFAIAVRAPSFHTAVAAGDADIARKLPLRPDSKFVWGSVTKLATGAAILRLADAGVFSLDDPVAPLVDDYLRAEVQRAHAAGLGPFNFTSLRDLFGPQAANVTVRQLATMRSGIPDYDTAKPDDNNRSLSVDPFRATCYAQPGHDYSPLDMLAVPWVHKDPPALDWPPGTDQDYSSTNFLLLGLVLAAQAEAGTWSALDQSAFRPAAMRRAGFMNGTAYAALGAPSRYTDVRGYDRTSYNGHTPDVAPGRDVGDVHGVFAGWTASDLVAPVQDVADLAHALYQRPHSELLRDGDVEMMTNASQGFYGFATFLLSSYSGQPTDAPAGQPNYGTLWGHLGATYGYNSMVQYNAALNVSIAVATNVESDYQAQPNDAFCSAYNQVRQLVLGLPEVAGNCTYLATGYYGKCVCETTKYTCSKREHHGRVEARCEASYFGNESYADCSATCQ